MHALTPARSLRTRVGVMSASVSVSHQDFQSLAPNNSRVDSKRRFPVYTPVSYAIDPWIATVNQGPTAGIEGVGCQTEKGDVSDRARHLTSLSLYATSVQYHHTNTYMYCTFGLTSLSLYATRIPPAEVDRTVPG